jgi:hypothetical protein
MRSVCVCVLSSKKEWKDTKLLKNRSPTLRKILMKMLLACLQT